MPNITLTIIVEKPTQEVSLCSLYKNTKKCSHYSKKKMITFYIKKLRSVRQGDMM